MKKVMIAVVFLVTVMSANANAPHNGVKRVAEGMDIVYLKVTCPMIGASIFVYNAQGEMIHTEVVRKRKVIVDFYAEPSGEYTIKVVKDGISETMTYSKTTESHAEMASEDFILIAQN